MAGKPFLVPSEPSRRNTISFLALSTENDKKAKHKNLCNMSVNEDHQKVADYPVIFMN